MGTISAKREQLVRSLRDKDARDAFIDAHVGNSISFQVRANRLRRNWSQGELAAKCGKKQSFISRLEGPRHSDPNVKTLKDLASAFDVGLMFRFTAFSELVDWILRLEEQGLSAPAYEDDRALYAHSEKPLQTPRVQLASSSTMQELATETTSSISSFEPGFRCPAQDLEAFRNLESRGSA